MIYLSYSGEWEITYKNMTLLSIALMIPHKVSISLGGFVYNLTAVTLGNIVGEMIFAGIAYWYISSKKA